MRDCSDIIFPVRTLLNNTLGNKVALYTSLMAFVGVIRIDLSSAHFPGMLGKLNIALAQAQTSRDLRTVIVDLNSSFNSHLPAGAPVCPIL